jgi:hypothetical protein
VVPVASTDRRLARLDHDAAYLRELVPARIKNPDEVLAVKAARSDG